jgi:hypothetical protein
VKLAERGDAHVARDVDRLLDLVVLDRHERPVDDRLHASSHGLRRHLDAAGREPLSDLPFDAAHVIPQSLLASLNPKSRAKRISSCRPHFAAEVST